MHNTHSIGGGRDLQLRAVNQLQRAKVVAERGGFRALVTRVERVPLGFETTLYIQGPDSWARYAANPAGFEARIRAIVAGRLGRAFNVEVTGVRRGSVEMMLAFAMADPVTAMAILHDTVILAKTMAEVARAVVDLFADASSASTEAGMGAWLWQAGLGAWLWKRALTLTALLLAAILS